MHFQEGNEALQVLKEYMHLKNTLGFLMFLQKFT